MKTTELELRRPERKRCKCGRTAVCEVRDLQGVTTIACGTEALLAISKDPSVVVTPLPGFALPGFAHG